MRSHTSEVPLLPFSLWLLGPALRPELALSASAWEPSDSWSWCQTGTGRGMRLGKLSPGAFQLQRRLSQSMGAEGEADRSPAGRARCWYMKQTVLHGRPAAAATDELHMQQSWYAEPCDRTFAASRALASQ